MGRVYNFSAGPAMLPEEVLRQAADEMLDYHGSGMSVMEMSHRGKVYDRIIKEAEQDFRELVGVPDNYRVLFLQGGGSTQFAMVPMNLTKNGTAAYVITGNWAKKAAEEAERYTKVVRVASSADKNYTYIPDCSDLDIPEEADYLYICENNTIYGTEYKTLPNTKGHVLVADVSSNFLSRPIDVTKYGMFFGGVQKNVGPAGVTIAVIREDLIRDDLPAYVPTMLRYKTHADKDSLYNTPPCYNIYVCGSYMNAPFVTGDKELDALFVKEAEAQGLVSLKGHRTVGGMRASMYNAMPVEGVEKLVEFMKDFEARH